MKDWAPCTTPRDMLNDLPLKPRLLVIEDDDSLREGLVLVLGNAGFSATGAADGTHGLQEFDGDRIDAVVLDLMLPGIDGLDVCRELRRRSTAPIVILTARVETASLVAGLECGADDYVTKPFDPAELVARLRAVLRRTSLTPAPDVLTVGDLVVDAAAFRLHKHGAPVHATATEFRVLVELLRAGGRVLTREQLLKRVWDYDYLGDSRLVDMAVKRLREKIEDNPSEPRYVVTVRGVGYRAEL